MPVNGNGKTVLLADDDPDIRDLFRCTLEAADFNVIEAEDGDKAVKLFTSRKDEISIFLSDVMMPKKNGVEAYIEIKKINPDIKALLMSGHSPDFLINKIISEDKCKFLMKPIAPLELLKQISEML